jgi:hypothetical protein
MTRADHDDGLTEFDEQRPTRQPGEYKGAPAGPTFDREAVHTHISMLHELAKDANVDGVLVLACYGENPDTGRKAQLQVQRFAIGDVKPMVDAIMGLEDHPHLNIYVPWHVVRRGLMGNERGSKGDILCTLALVVDSDDDTGKAGRLPLPAPYVIESSDGNFQPVYPLDRALLLSEAEPLAKALQKATGTDSGTGDIAHVWRVPGTLNWPNARKIKRGRSRIPQPVRVSTPWSGELVEPEKLLQAVAVHSNANGAKTNGHDHSEDIDSTWHLPFTTLPAALKKLITSPPTPDEDRSAVAASVICQLIGRRWSDAAIAAVIRAHPRGIGARYTEGNNLERDIARLQGKRKQTDSKRAALPELDLDAIRVAAAKELASLIAERRDVFLNGYTPVRVVIEAGQEPRAIPLNVEAVRAYAFEICRCMKTTRDGRREVTLTRDVAQLYLHGLEGQWGLRPLRGISTTPLLGDDGSIRNATGYDEARGLWCYDAPTPVVPGQR